METILVVEGGDGTSHYLAAGLSSSGRRVIGARTAQEALAALAARRPTAAFVRLMGSSPPITKTCQQLRRDARLEHAALLVCGESVQQAEQAFASGADDFFLVPKSAQELKTRLTSAEARPIRSPPQLKTILVVDDDVFFRRTMADLLASEGYQTLEAGSGAEALRLVESHSPAVAVVDLFMPDLGGVEFVQQLRASPRWRRLPVVAISGMRAAHEKGLVATLDGLQVHDFIEKRGPALETLAAVVDEVLRDDVERHRAARVSTGLLGEFRPTPDQPWISALICNLGMGGAFVRTLVVPQAERMVHFRLDPGDGRPRIVCRANVVWVRPRSAPGSVVGMGVEFAELGSADRETLRSLMYA